MLNAKLKLDENFFDNPDKGALRDGFGRALADLGRVHETVVAACADLTESTRMHWFKEEFPDRFFEVGITEQHMAAFASGMASMGKVPYISSYAMFSPGRNWEQIRTTICYNNSKVVIVGSHAGVSVGPDGGTHQALEDVALMRVLPRMTVLTPADEYEAYKATIASFEIKGPVYIRLAREKTPIFTTKETPFEVGKINEIFRSENPNIVIFASGTSVHEALRAAQHLEKEGIGSIVANVSTVKPMDTEAIITLASETGRVVTIENHQVYGGMGSAIAEVLSVNLPTPMKMIGVQDKFGQSGSPEELLEYYGLNLQSIVEKIKEFLN